MKSHAKNWIFHCLLSVCVCLTASIALSSVVWDGSRTLPVHKVAIFDENGDKIIPYSDNPMPVSTRKTCGACHDYKKISGGHHFNAEKGKRAGEPWVLVDEKSGTQIPLSTRGSEVLFSPEVLGMDEWDLLKAFGRHMPGGGAEGEPTDTMKRPGARWSISGKLEINCFACHNDAICQDMTEWTKQIARENFRWAGTAAAGLGDVSGTASRMNSSWIIADGADPDDTTYRVPPSVKYDMSLFDGKNRILFDVGKPADSRCLFCHSVAQVDVHKEESYGDIHSSSGLSCVKCHRNGLDHDISRGIDGVLSCEGCHESGTYGAPAAVHKGLSEVHMQKLTCTACHSGAAVGAKPAVVRTARANRLGIYGKAQWYTEAPVVIEPVFLKGDDGKIGPYRMMWPAFWGSLEGDKVTPLKPADVMEKAEDLLDPSRIAGNVLWALSKVTDIEDNPIGTTVFFAGGKAYKRNVDGGLDVADSSLKQPGNDLFGYVVSNSVVSAIASYDMSDEYAFGEAQGQLLKYIDALNKIPGDDEAVYVQSGKVHKIVDRKFSEVPAEEAAKFKKVLSDAQAAVDNKAKEHNIFIEGARYYDKATRDKLKSKHPGVVAIKKLLPAMKEAAVAVAELIEVGGVVYRKTSERAIEVSGAEIGQPKGDGPTLGWISDGKFKALLPDYIDEMVAVVGGKAETVFTEMQVAMTLERLGAGHVYVSNGKMFRLDDEKQLIADDHASAAPVSWALGHDVRPAAQSLGAKSCTECHAKDAPFFFASISALGPMMTDKGAVTPMHEFAGVNSNLHAMYGGAFKYRGLVSFLTLCCVGVVGLIVLLFVLAALSRIVKLVSGKDIQV